MSVFGNRKDKKEIKSDFLREHWNLASEMYHLVAKAVTYYDFDNPSSFTKSYQGKSFDDNIFDLTLVIEAFENAWSSLYKNYLLESLR
ncbi:MAG: hypothetical protein AAF611_21850 [Bacteroidota bacterium]